jgi:PAS domain S-box-containing protein
MALPEGAYKRILDNLLEGCQLISPDWRYLYVNAAIAEQGKRTKEELLGGRMLDLYPGIEHTAVFGKIREVMETGRAVRMENKFTFPDGSEGWFDLSMQRVPEGVFIMSLDMTSHKRAEEEIRRLNEDLAHKVEERTAELVAANRDLESFAYSVSHDLRAPLRAIDGFARIVSERFADRLDAEGSRLLGVIRDNARRMEELIHDLLALSRVGRTEMGLAPVDMAALAADAYQEAVPPEERARCAFTLADLPAARGDGALLRRVWINLLSNAAKFASPMDHPSIEAGGRRDPDGATYWVRDNGVGFDPEYAHKLFGVFQRLHSSDEFEGTGVGLAIVQRVVQRHGGKVWAESEVGKGATFYFTLPAPEEASDP